MPAWKCKDTESAISSNIIESSLSSGETSINEIIVSIESNQSTSSNNSYEKPKILIYDDNNNNKTNSSCSDTSQILTEGNNPF